MKVHAKGLYTQTELYTAVGLTMHQFKLDQDAGLIPFPTVRPLGRRAYYTAEERKLILAFYAGEDEEGTNDNS